MIIAWSLQVQAFETTGISQKTVLVAMKALLLRARRSMQTLALLPGV